MLRQERAQSWHQRVSFVLVHPRIDFSGDEFQFTVRQIVGDTDIIKGKKYTDRECDRLMWNDLQPIKKAVDGMVKIPLGEYQRAALYSFTYNVGTNAFSKSTLLKRLNAGDVDGACEELRRWIYAGGQKWRGLMNRRDMERTMCLAESADDLKV